MWCPDGSYKVIDGSSRDGSCKVTGKGSSPLTTSVRVFSPEGFCYVPGWRETWSGWDQKEIFS